MNVKHGGERNLSKTEKYFTDPTWIRKNYIIYNRRLTPYYIQNGGIKNGKQSIGNDGRNQYGES